MARVQAGDEAAFGALMERWERPVKSVVARMVLNVSEAEDLAQETMVRVWQQRARFRAGAEFRPWIFAIAVNLARNRLRWWRRRPEVALPVELREAIVLFEYEQMAQAEIAVVVGATPKAVETRIYRAREKLRAALQRWA